MALPTITYDNGLVKELTEGASALGIALDEIAVKNFMLYLNELKRWGSKMNLTGRADGHEIINRHFLDSLTLLPTLRALKCEKILDMGSGAGFPGLVLKIAAPKLEITLMDSREKRVFFLRHIIRSLNLSEGISTIKSRAEDIPTGYASNFDCVTSRAFSHLSSFLPLAMPYLQEYGYIIAMKGPTAQEELKGLDTNGLGEANLVQASLPGSRRETLLMVFKRLGKALDQ